MIEEYPPDDFILRGIDAEAESWVKSEDTSKWLDLMSQALFSSMPAQFKARFRRLLGTIAKQSYNEGFYGGALAVTSGKSVETSILEGEEAHRA